jgi:hypothetical protein
MIDYWFNAFVRVVLNAVDFATNRVRLLTFRIAMFGPLA